MTYGYTSRLYADVSAVLAQGDVPPPAPTLGVCDDGVGLFYAGQYNAVLGDPESGKTLLAQSVAADVLFSGGSVLVIDLDHNGAQPTVSRFRGLGVAADVLSDPSRFRYTNADTVEDVLNVVNEAKLWKPTFVILDSIGELLPLFGASSNNSDEYTQVLARTITPMIVAGCCVVGIDHMAKGQASRDYGATGTTAKKRSIGGTMFRVDVRTQFTPGKGGESALMMLKDRHGGLRARRAPGREPMAAIYRLEDRGNGAQHWTFRAPQQADYATATDSPSVTADVAQLAKLVPPPASVRDVKGRMQWASDRASHALKVFREQSNLRNSQERQEQV